MIGASFGQEVAGTPGTGGQSPKEVGWSRVDARFQVSGNPDVHHGRAGLAGRLPPRPPQTPNVDRWEAL